MSFGDSPVDGLAVAISRLNIDDFSTKQGFGIQRGLYLRAQIAFQKCKPEDPFGYHGLAGIYFHPFDFNLFLTAIRHSLPATQDVAGREICPGSGVLLFTCPVGLISTSKSLQPTPFVHPSGGTY